MTENWLVPARAEDIEEIDDFLAPLTATSMFLRSNIRDHGVTGGTDRFATRVWLDRQGSELVGVIGLTGGGIVLLQAELAAIPQMVTALAGQTVNGISGEAGQVRAFRTAAQLEGDAVLDKDDWLYELDLVDLVVPAGDGSVRAAERADIPLLELWRAAYHVEALGMDPSDAPEQARRDVAAMLAAGTCRLLMRDGVPVGMTALNAAVPGWAQVGGVYTPPGHRRLGVARCLVAGHLAELRGAGVRRAVLFASDPAARRAYEAIGFQRCGSYGLALFAGPRLVGR